jgi:hypothetical protein
MAMMHIMGVGMGIFSVCVGLCHFQFSREA